MILADFEQKLTWVLFPPFRGCDYYSILYLKSYIFLPARTYSPFLFTVWGNFSLWVYLHTFPLVQPLAITVWNILFFCFIFIRCLSLWFNFNIILYFNFVFCSRAKTICALVFVSFTLFPLQILIQLPLQCVSIYKQNLVLRHVFYFL